MPRYPEIKVYLTNRDGMLSLSFRGVKMPWS